MIHHSHVKCDDCGERHTPGNLEECVAVLVGQRDDWRARARALDAEAVLAALRHAEAEAMALVLNHEGRIERLEKALRNIGHDWCREHCDSDDHTYECEHAIAALAGGAEEETK